jgi:predicted RNase H-like HicB family nuclease
MKLSSKRYRLSAVFWREGRQIVGQCPELGVSSFGATLEASEKRLKQAVDLYLENAKSLGLLKDLKPTLEATERYNTIIEVPA